MNYLDKIRGMICGAALGDSLGAPHEFRCSKAKYTGILEHETIHVGMFGIKKKLAVGQCTDDTEMTLVLLRYLIECGGDFDKDETVKLYIEWANSGLWMLGRNTRQLFKQIKTLNGYKSRAEKVFSGEKSQSNGSLMRCMGFALLANFHNVKVDTDLTNPNEINRDASFVYVTALRSALIGKSKEQIFESAMENAETNLIKKCLKNALKGKKIDVVHQKGWVLHAIYMSFYVLMHFDVYHDAMDYVIGCNPGSDTDTNAFIAGALIGAYVGFNEINSHQTTKANIKIMFKCANHIDSSPTPRQSKYTLKDFDELCIAANELFLSGI